MSRGFYILLLLMIAGAVSIALIVKRKPAPERQQLWLKYFVYLGIVGLVIAVLNFASGFLFWIALLIVVAGFAEIIRLVKTRLQHYLPAIIFYLLIIVLFLLHTRQAVFTVFYTFMMIVTFDSFSQLTGQLFGRLKLLPAISPNKTVAGLIGGTFIALLVSQLIQPGTVTVFAALFICCFGFAGDLLASLLKRKTGVKDYSRAIPGHGGFLDRFDSWLMAGAACELYRLLFHQPIIW